MLGCFWLHSRLWIRAFAWKHPVAVWRGIISYPVLLLSNITTNKWSDFREKLEIHIFLFLQCRRKCTESSIYDKWTVPGILSPVSLRLPLLVGNNLTCKYCFEILFVFSPFADRLEPQEYAETDHAHSPHDRARVLLKDKANLQNESVSWTQEREVWNRILFRKDFYLLIWGWRTCVEVSALHIVAGKTHEHCESCRD